LPIRSCSTNHGTRRRDGADLRQCIGSLLAAAQAS